MRQLDGKYGSTKNALPAPMIETPNPQLYLAQIDAHVGDISGNTQRILDVIQDAASSNADIIIFPELMLCGYPPEDLLLRPSMNLRVERAIDEIQTQVGHQAVVMGYPLLIEGQLFNAAGVFRDGEKVAEYRKQCLPNYRVFDEKRYFVAGTEPCVFEHAGVRFGLTICEDIWHESPTKASVVAGAQALININASPYNKTQHAQRLDVLRKRATEHYIPIVYLNLVGGQDELVFDGGSLIMDADGQRQAQLPWFQESQNLQPLYKQSEQSVSLIEPEALEAFVYKALVLGVRDYVNKNGFPSVVLGLSGGIDSALTLAVAVDALGADRVHAVMMPFHYTSNMSQEDAAAQASTMNARYSVISIASLFEGFSEALSSQFLGLPEDTTEQNIQSRCRGVLLMAISNKTGSLVLTTGNKSEVAVGYATLYGDMAGGFDVLKDVSKTLVYRLAQYRNTLGEVIPPRVIERPPSAELAPDQIDEDNLPAYDILDPILEHYIEQDMSAESIIAAGFEAEVVKKVVRLVDLNEYKRRQAAIGPRITERGFGRDRRYPITNGWEIGD